MPDTLSHAAVRRRSDNELICLIDLRKPLTEKCFLGFSQRGKHHLVILNGIGRFATVPSPYFYTVFGRDRCSKGYLVESISDSEYEMLREFGVYRLLI